MATPKDVRPKTFYLNEQHELTRGEREGGGSIPQYTGIDWPAKGTKIRRSLLSARTQLLSSRDPIKENHFFLLANPEEQLAKISKDKKKAPHGEFREDTDYSKKHSRVFRRLGVDLLQVASDGSAVVHMNPEVFDHLATTAGSIARLGAREQARWATIESFAMVPPEMRIDQGWLSRLRAKQLTDAVVELQPLLSRIEIDGLMRTLVSMLGRQQGETITGTGTDFSGRHWLRGRITADTLKTLARDFFSIQSLHSPLISAAASPVATAKQPSALVAPPIDFSTLPSVGVVDTGIPLEHAILKPYRRGTYVAPITSPTTTSDHAAFVASRVVFGGQDFSSGPPSKTPLPQARYYDINVSGLNRGQVEDKSVYPAFQAVVATAPDVRVFNMSFDSVEPWSSMEPVKRFEALALVQDLDNFIFQYDVLVAIAAGNSPPGVLPMKPYPQHFDDPNWALGPWSRSFNALTCGSYVDRISPHGLVKQLGWPSPFCRVGPGLADSPKPDFSAEGGNGTPQYGSASGLGVWGLGDAGMWEDRSGTSYAAPLLAREAAFCLHKLQDVCVQGARPFSVTAKAFLAITATPPASHDAIATLGERTLGRGTAHVEKLNRPSPASSIMLWQGVLENDSDVARVQLPIPKTWTAEASEPFVRIITVWDPPVNAALTNLWSTRNVITRLRPDPEMRALHPSTHKSHKSYPFSDKMYNLSKLSDQKVDRDLWALELYYEQIGEYHPALDFPPQQRVAIAAELFDRGAKVSPQAALQSLPIAQTMTRLSIPPMVARTPVIIKTTG